MKKIVYFIFTLFISVNIFAQDETVKIIGESGDGKSIKLIWFFKTWEKSTIGFEIKRRTVEIATKGDWIKLTPTPIAPSISVNKNLSNTGISDTEAQRIKQKLENLIENKKVREITEEEYLYKLETDENALQGLSFAIGLDYDFAIINGFAFIDNKPEDGKTYEYGLFMVKRNKIDDKPASIMTWTSGTKSNLNPDIKIKGKTFVKVGKVQLRWNVDENKMKNIFPAGFNIYKKDGSAWIKLNTDPVNSKPEGTGYYWLDTTATFTENTIYGIALQSIFKNEGDKSIYIYRPAENPAVYKSPVLDEVVSAGEYFSNGFSVKWTFPKEDEMFIRSFIIEKANRPDGFKKIYEIIPKERTFTDHTYSPPASYVSFRVIAVYLDGSTLSSNEQIIYYLPVIMPPQPQNLKVKWVFNEKKLFAELSWDPKNKKDTITDYFLIYASNPVNGLFAQAGGMPIYENTFKYEIIYGEASFYKFGISAMGKYKSEGPLSDTFSTMSPSQRLPYIHINKLEQDSNRVSIHWDYPVIWDLKGFRVFQNGNMVANEFQLGKTIRIFKTPGLKWGNDYIFTVQAVSENGVTSDISIPSGITILNIKR